MYLISTNIDYDEESVEPKIDHIYNISLEKDREDGNTSTAYTLDQVEELLYKHIDTIVRIEIYQKLPSEIRELYIKFLLDAKCRVNTLTFMEIDPINEILENSHTITNISILGSIININDSVNNTLIDMVKNGNLKKIYLETFECIGMKDWDYLMENDILQFEQMQEFSMS
jgi:hypothetical protein